MTSEAMIEGVVEEYVKKGVYSEEAILRGMEKNSEFFDADVEMVESLLASGTDNTVLDFRQHVERRMRIEDTNPVAIAEEYKEKKVPPASRANRYIDSFIDSQNICSNCSNSLFYDQREEEIYCPICEA